MVRTFDRSETNSGPTHHWKAPCAEDHTCVPGIPHPLTGPHRDLLHSPCTKACGLDRDGVCTGCGRSFDEILEWATMTMAMRLETIETATRRLAARNPLWNFASFEV